MSHARFSGFRQPKRFPVPLYSILFRNIHRPHQQKTNCARGRARKRASCCSKVNRHSCSSDASITNRLQIYLFPLPFPHVNPCVDTKSSPARPALTPTPSAAGATTLEAWAAVSSPFVASGSVATRAASFSDCGARVSAALSSARKGESPPSVSPARPLAFAAPGWANGERSITARQSHGVSGGRGGCSGASPFFPAGGFFPPPFLAFLPPVFPSSAAGSDRSSRRSRRTGNVVDEFLASVGLAGGGPSSEPLLSPLPPPWGALKRARRSSRMDVRCRNVLLVWKDGNRTDQVPVGGSRWTSGVGSASPLALALALLPSPRDEAEADAWPWLPASSAESPAVVDAT